MALSLNRPPSVVDAFVTNDPRLPSVEDSHYGPHTPRPETRGSGGDVCIELGQRVSVTVPPVNEEEEVEEEGEEEEEEEEEEAADVEETPVLAKLLDVERGDPPMALHLSGEEGCVAIGTMLGRVVAYFFQQPLEQCLYGDPKAPKTASNQAPSRFFSAVSQHSSQSTTKSKRTASAVCSFIKRGGKQRNPPLTLSKPPPGRLQLFAAFSDDAIRALYLDATHLYAVIGNQHCRTWRKLAPRVQGGFRFDRRITSAYKYVLPYSPYALIVTTGITIVAKLPQEQQLNVPFKLPDKDLVPCDFNGTHMLMVTHASSENRLPQSNLKVIKLNATVEEPRWGHTVESVFHQDIPVKTKLFIHAKFWDPGRVVTVRWGRVIDVQSISKNEKLMDVSFRKGEGDVACLDTSHPDRLLAMSTKGILRLWDRSGLCLQTVCCSVAKFHLGFRYFLTHYGNFVVFSADEGAYILDLRRPYPPKTPSPTPPVPDAPEGGNAPPPTSSSSSSSSGLYVSPMSHVSQPDRRSDGAIAAR